MHHLLHFNRIQSKFNASDWPLGDTIPPQSEALAALKLRSVLCGIRALTSPFLFSHKKSHQSERRCADVGVSLHSLQELESVLALNLRSSPTHGEFN